MSRVARPAGVRAKLLLPVVIALGVLIVGQAVITTRYDQQDSNREEQNMLQTELRDILNIIKTQENVAALVASELAARADVSSVLLRHDRDSMHALLSPVFDRMKQQSSVSQMFVHDAGGTVFLRVHDRAVYGDQYTSYRGTLTDAIAARAPTAGIEPDAQRLGIRGVAPIVRDRSLLGFVEITLNFDDAFLQQLKSERSIDVNLWVSYSAAGPAGLWPRGGGAPSPTSDLFWYAGTLPQAWQIAPSAYERALVGMQPELFCVRAAGIPYAVQLSPLHGYHDAHIGVLEIVRSRTVALDMLRRKNTVTVVLALLVSVLAIGLTLFIARRVVLKPLSQAAGVAQQQLAGNLGARVTWTAKDEFGHLAHTLNTLSDQLDRTLSSQQQSIAELEAARQELRAREEDLRITLLSIGDAVLATDVHGLVTRMNPVAEHLTGWAASDALGKPFRDVFCAVSAISDQPIESPVEKVVRTGKTVGLTNHTVLISRTGTRRQIADSAAPIRDPSGAIRGAVLVFRDITEQEKLEEQLRHAQRMDTVGRLAGGVAHDFNNLLAGIGGYAELLCLSTKEAETRQSARQIVETVREAAELTKRLLVLSRKSAIKVESVDVHQVVEEVVALVSRTIDRRIAITADLRALRSTARVDRVLLQGALLNLAVNARDAMPEGGTLQFVTENRSADCGRSLSHLPLSEPGECVVLTVRDNGTGMDPEVRTHLFEPFFTTKSAGRGVGLGLASVYSSVSEMKGGIHVESTLGHGSSFALWIPVSEQLRPRPALLSAESTQGSGRVLVVDDEEVVRKVTARILTLAGYTVAVAENGRSAIEMFRLAQPQFDLVILDALMPDLTGSKTLLALKQIDPHVKALLVTGFDANDGPCDWKEVGFLCRIQKPFRIDELTTAVAEALPGSSGRASASRIEPNAGIV